MNLAKTGGGKHIIEVSNVHGDRGRAGTAWILRRLAFVAGVLRLGVPPACGETPTHVKEGLGNVRRIWLQDGTSVF